MHLPPKSHKKQKRLKRTYFPPRLQFLELVFRFLMWIFVDVKGVFLFGILTPYLGNPNARSFYIFYISDLVWYGLKNNSVIQYAYIWALKHLQVVTHANICKVCMLKLNFAQVFVGTQTIFIVLGDVFRCFETVQVPYKCRKTLNLKCVFDGKTYINK